MEENLTFAECALLLLLFAYCLVSFMTLLEIRKKVDWVLINTLEFKSRLDLQEQLDFFTTKTCGPETVPGRSNNSNGNESEKSSSDGALTK